MPRPKKEAPNRKDGLYEVKITVGKRLDGSLIRKSFYSSISKADAKAQAERYKVEKAVAEQTGSAFVTCSRHFDEWARYWLKTYKLGKVKGNTYIGTYQIPVENHLIPYFGSAMLSDIRPADIQDFFNLKSKTSALESQKKMRTCLFRIFDTALENDLCRKNPVTKNITLHSAIQKPEKRVYTAEQYQIIEGFARERNALDILVLLQTGISRSELLGLKWVDFNQEENILYITQGTVQYKDPETGQWTLQSDGLKNDYRSRPIPIGDELAALLRAKPRTIQVGGNRKKGIPPRDVTPEYIFHASNGKAFSPTNWRHRQYDTFMSALIAKYPEIPALTPHELRHTRATLWKDQDVDIFSVAKLMGHSDLDMLAKKYAHNNVETLKKALKL